MFKVQWSSYTRNCASLSWRSKTWQSSFEGHRISVLFELSVQSNFWVLWLNWYSEALRSRRFTDMVRKSCGLCPATQSMGGSGCYGSQQWEFLSSPRHILDNSGLPKTQKFGEQRAGKRQVLPLLTKPNFKSSTIPRCKERNEQRMVLERPFASRVVRTVRC